MPSEKFRITTNGQSLRNLNNGFFGMTLSANNMTLDESDGSAQNDRRSAHNALERQRREHLNVKFQQLAHALPALQTVRRPSKTMIVAKSLEFVSSSLKRENTYMSEIQKLRLENEKLKAQAVASSNQLKKQLSYDDTQQDQPVEEEQTKAALKRKTTDDSTSSQQQLSPPPTPEAMRGGGSSATTTTAASKKKQYTSQTSIVVEQQQPPQKKKKVMVKQTKSLQAQLLPPQHDLTAPTAITTVNSSHHLLVQQQQQPYIPTGITSPWSPLDDTTTNNLIYPSSTLSSPSNYFDIHTTNNNHMTSFHPTTALDLYQQQQQHFHATTVTIANMMNPMLLSPYFVPSTANDTTVEVAHHLYYPRDRSNNSINSYYLSSSQ